MKKSLTLLITLIALPIIGGVYGIIHDQFTYTISHEYFTKFKFYQFGLADVGNEAILPNPRLSVAIVGFLATWWVGIIIAIGLCLTGLLQQDHKRMVSTIIKATLITLSTTAITGLIGLAYGNLYLTKTGVDWWLPDNLVDRNAFITVGSMHNFSYLGGAIGLVIGIIYQIAKAVKNKKERNLQAIPS